MAREAMTKLIEGAGFSLHVFLFDALEFLYFPKTACMSRWCEE